MKKEFGVGLAITACLLVALLSSVQSHAEVNDECTLNCQASLTKCLENTPAMDHNQQQDRNAVCEEQKERCLSVCTQPQPAEGK